MVFLIQYIFAFRWSNVYSTVITVICNILFIQAFYLQSWSTINDSKLCWIIWRSTKINCLCLFWRQITSGPYTCFVFNRIIFWTFQVPCTSKYMQQWIRLPINWKNNRISNYLQKLLNMYHSDVAIGVEDLFKYWQS